MAKIESADLTKVKCKKEFGDWYYHKRVPACWNNLEADAFDLYDAECDIVRTFASYNEMKAYIEEEQCERV